jgi:hypothetical protein
LAIDRKQLKDRPQEVEGEKASEQSEILKKRTMRETG